MDFKVNGIKYKLTKASIYISELYQKYVVLLNEDATSSSDFEEARLNALLEKEEAKTTSERLRAEIKLHRAIKAAKNKYLDMITVEAVAARREILREIFILNCPDEEFDEVEWVKTMGENDFNDLIKELFANKKKDAKLKPST